MDIKQSKAVISNGTNPCGRKQRRFSRAAHTLMATLLLGTSAVALGYSEAMATDVTIAPTWNSSNNNEAGAYLLNNGDTVNMTGTFTLAPSTWPGGSMTIYQFQQAGALTGVGLPNLATSYYLTLGAQNYAVTVPDPITGGTKTVNAYSNSNIFYRPADGSAGAVGTMPYYTSAAASNIYTDLRLATVSDGTLNINVRSAALNNTGASLGTAISIGVKDTALVLANGTGNAVWQGNASVSFMAAKNISVTATSGQPYAYNLTTASLNGTFTAYDGSSHTVTTLAEWQAYNSWLIAEMQAGRLNPNSYTAEFNKAYTNNTYAATLDPTLGHPIAPDDPLYDPTIKQFIMQADGSGATARIATGANVWVTGGSVTTSGVPSGALYATNGGTVINDGLISTRGSEQPNGIWAAAGSTGINNGVRTLGYFSTLEQNAALPAGVTTETGFDRATGVGAQYINNGIINLAGYTYATTTATFYGILIANGASGTNHGTVNVGVNNNTTTGILYGVNISGGANSTFTNAVDGVIYIGRAPSADTSLAPIDRGGADVSSLSGGAGFLIQSQTSGYNDGHIIIGSQMQNSTGMYGVNTTYAVVNRGIIDVNGNVSGSPGQNRGMWLNTDASPNNLNSGTINLNGVNGVGVYAVTGSRATSSGTINITAGSDPATGLRNYGIWSDSGSIVTLTGTVNMAGDGAIGIHARNSGQVTISGGGKVVFASGKNQIGYFVYGPGASITNTGTGAQDVSTESSVLFRMEDGASFTGGAGATSVLTASGKSSTAVVVTGKDAASGTVSAFNSGGMTINATGENAVAVLVEGGAQGKITSAATINLTGIGAIAGIADGQKHALDGSASGAPIAGVLSNAALNAGAAGFGTGTLLVAGANLNSALDQVTGYIARNGASLSNSGNIVFTGAHTTGINVQEGSTGGNSGAITIQDGSVGLIASSTGAVTTLNNSGNITLKGGSNADRTTGISASGSAVTVNMSAGTIALQGQGAVGAAAYAGAKVNLTGTASAQFSSDPLVTDQILLLVSGAGSTVNTATSGGGSLDASGTNSTLIRLESGATQSGVLNMGASGNGARGIWATGAGTKVTALSGSTFNVAGTNAEAVLVQGGAEVDLKAGTIVNLTGTNTVVGTVDGNEYALDGTTIINSNTGSKLVSEATLNSTTVGATGFITQNAGNLINSGNITFSGANSAAIKVINGNFTNVSGNVIANGVALDVTGASSTVDVQGGMVKASDGVAAIRIGTDASLNLVGSGLGVVTASGTAHAVLVDTGAKGLVIDGAHIDMASTGAGTGNGVENKAEIAGIQLTNTTVIDVMDGKGIRTAATLAQTNAGTINVKGSGTGIAFETATGGAMSNNIDFSNSNGLTVNVSSASGTGISVKHTGGGDVKNGANVNVTNAAGGSTVVLSGVSTFSNTGKLISASTSAPVVALGVTKSVTNAAGAEITASSATAAAMTFDGQDSTLSNSGKITGVIDLGAGTNSATNAAGATITGNIISATGNNTVTNSGTIVGNIALGSGTNNVTLNAGSSVTNVTGTTGVNNVTVKGNAAFTLLDGGVGGGNDTLTFDGATHTLSSASAIDHYETMRLVNGATITTADLIKMTDTVGGVGSISIDATSKLAITAPVGYTLNHALSGTGVISAQMASGANAFNFGSSAGSAFAGTVQMGTGSLALAGDNTTALTSATLRVDTGSVTTVGTGNQAIGGLTFNGGTMVFDATAPAQTVATGYVTAGKLDISGTGTVKVTVPTGFDNTQPVPNTSLPLLQQDDATAMTKLVGSSNVTGSGGALSLVDQNGVAITNAKTLDINQNSTKVAEGTYDYRLLNSSNGATADGLYVGYGLTQVNLIGTGANALVLTPATGASGVATDLSAKVIGTGDLAIVAGTGKTVTLSNTLNSFSGVTDVQTGTLKMAANNVLGVTSSLNVASGAAFDTAGYNQSVGALNTAAGGKATIAAGSTLTIVDTQRTGGGSDGGAIDDSTLFGGGAFVIDPSIVRVNGTQAGYTGLLSVTNGSQLILNTANAFDNAQGVALVSAADRMTFGDLSGYNPAWTAIPNGTAAMKISGLGVVETRNASDVTLAGDNSAFSGQFDVGTGTFLRASQAKNLGTAGILASGTFNAIANTDWEMTNLVTGSGTVLKTGSGLLKVGDDTLRNFTGLTDIQAGTLQIGAYANDDAAIGGTVRIASGAQMGGTGTVHGDVENTGTITSLNALAAYSGSGEVSNITILGTLTNSGNVQLGGTKVGNTLTVNSIVGNGGTFVLNTVLGDDSSLTDRIIVNGGTVTGSSFIAIVNQGGLGAQTTGNGIQVVTAQNGATTDTGAFTLAGRVAAGAYEYNLVRGDRSGSGDDWFLRTPDPEVPDAPAVTNGLRPEIPTNAAIMPLAAEFGYAMLGTLHERTGGAFINAKPVFEDRVVWCKDAAQNFKCTARTALQGNDNQAYAAGGWARLFADRGEHSQKNFLRHGSDYSYTLGGAQVGLDVFAREAADGTLDKAGIYVGYGQVSANIKGVNGGKAGSVDLTGSSVGAYWTHYAASGWYTDAVIQGTWYSADARSVKGEQVKPDGFGLIASLEGGYQFKLGSGWTLEPQAQVIYQTLSFDKTADHYGTFRFQDGDSLRARLGARLARTWNNGTDQNPRLVTAWLRANVWHEFGGKYKMTTATFSNTDPFLTTTTLGGTWGEIGAGVTAQVSDKVNLFATGAYQHSLDNKGRQSWNGRLGLNVKW